MRRDPKQGVYMIGVVATRYNIHPQTLRLYEREGLLRPSRTEGKTRLYSDENLERLEFILSLVRDLGVNLAGVEVVLDLRSRMQQMQSEMISALETMEQRMRDAGLDPGKHHTPAKSTGLVKLPPQGLVKR
ncbi:MAG: helix-turn-helix transcriptional regulator [Holophagaceae bacterium]|nr:helix-turn-helix transcriptional regulator [Holophagaceae bacterium]